MTAVVALALLVVVVLWVVMGEPVGHILRQRRRKSVLVTTKSEATFRGVLFQVDRHSMVLRNAEVVVAGENPTVVDGELILPRAEVAFLQHT